jgi:hypothetical protein
MVKECLLQDLQAGQIQPNSAVDISLEMTRTPCEGCAVRIPEGIRLLKSDPSLKDLNIRMIVNASTITLGSGETGLKKLLSQENVQVKGSDIWSVILAKLEEYPSFYDEVKAEHYTRPELNEFKTRAVELQGEIDAIVDSKKAGPRPLSRGR